MVARVGLSAPGSILAEPAGKIRTFYNALTIFPAFTHTALTAAASDVHSNAGFGSRMVRGSGRHNKRQKMKIRHLAAIALAAGLAATAIIAQDDPSGPPAGDNSGPPGGPPRGGPGGRRRPPAIVAALDANHDGIISADEIANAAKALLTLDKNGDGQITLDEALGFTPGKGPGGPGGGPPEDAPPGGADGAPPGGGPDAGQPPPAHGKNGGHHPPVPPIFAALDTN